MNWDFGAEQRTQKLPTDLEGEEGCPAVYRGGMWVKGISAIVCDGRDLGVPKC